MESESRDPLTYQVGGLHYRQYRYQPIEFFRDIHLDFCRANILKYLARWRAKDGVEDLVKALHYLQFALKDQEEIIAKSERFLDQFVVEDSRIMNLVLCGDFRKAIEALEQRIRSVEKAVVVGKTRGGLPVVMGESSLVEIDRDI